MPAGVLFINKQDAYDTWGISMKETGLSALMTPSALKPRIENYYRVQHGKEVLNPQPRWEPRELTLEIHLFAKDNEEFLERYGDFCNDVLSTGELNIMTKYQPDVCYKCYYVSCSQFGEFNMRYASFALRLEEPDPTDRDLPEDYTNIWSSTEQS